VNPLLRFLTSSIGRKWVVALTGLALFGFVVGHLIGNLQIFLGWEAINRYGAFLQGLGELLWAVRLGLLVMVVLHIVFTIKLRAENRAAKEQRYAVTQYRATSAAARWMTLSGLMVLCFIIYHLLHFTVQAPAVNFTSPVVDFTELHDAKARHDVYGMMIRGFQVPIVSFFYLLSVGLLALHLNHEHGADAGLECRQAASALGEGRSGLLVAHLPRLRVDPHRGPLRCFRKVIL
jgi:succinate dehydrogenase / fumarate reductase, cytochrome b subunit